MKALFILVCVILFFWVMARIGRKFQDSQWVATAKYIDIEDSLALPEVTICPVKPFKDHALDVLTNFEGLTYEEAEIIQYLGLNWTVYSREVQSLNKGKCFTAFFNQKVEANVNVETFNLPKNMDFDIYFHASGIIFQSLYLDFWHNKSFVLGQNVWLNFDQKPKCITKTTLSTNNGAWAKIHLTKQVSQQISSATESCSDDTAAAPETCFENEITSQLESHLSCRPVTLGFFDLNLGLCNNSADTAYAIQQANAKALAIDCQRKCTVEKFLVDHVEYLQKESHANPDLIEDNEFQLVLTFDETKVTLMMDFHIYDELDMVMAVGGILAFFLGFSLLSVLLDCVDVVYRACGNQDDTKISVFKRTFRQ